MKKYIAIILAVIMVLSTNLTAFALAYDGIESKLVTMEEYYDSNGAKHERYLDENGNEVYPEFETNMIHTNVTLPSSYDARTTDRVTSVKNQNPFGTCWAHAFCASAEASLITKGYETTESIDLSEAHLVWFSFNNYVAGSSKPWEGDNYASSNPFDNGGNSFLASSTVARGSGLTTEAKYPYSTTASKMEFKAKEKYVSDYQLDSMISYPATDRTAVKEAIMKNGSIATSYFSDNNYYANSSDGYCYYQNVQTGTNHAVTAVGWDDNFPASNFKTNPAGNGAWLIKNSWGPNWGTSGYFWLSYYDTSVSEFEEVNAKPAGDYAHIYQYDGIDTYSYRYYTNFYTIYYANIFTADGTQTVDATYFKVVDGCTATAYLYTDLSSSTNPASGTVRSSATVECPSGGYYTAKFSEHYKVTSGQKFAIVIKVDTDSVNAKAPIELATGSRTYTASAEQSFFSYRLTSWTDCGSSYSGNVPVKALTNDYSTAKVTSITLTHFPNKTSYVIGDSFDPTGLIVTANYDDGTKKAIDSSEYTISGFDSDTTGQKTITVSYNGFTATFTVDVDCMNHNYSDTVTEPTWESAGLTVHKCTLCGYEYSEVTHMSGVNYNATWTFDETTGALTIDGTGNMNDYSDSNNPFMNNQYIKTINIGAEITRLPAKMFVGQSNLEAVNISPDNYNFVLADNTLYNGDKTELVYCFIKNGESYTVPATVRTVDGYAFAEYGNLKDVYFNDKGEVWGSVSIGDGNDSLLNATMHFRYDGIETTLNNKGTLMFGFNEGTKANELGNYITSESAVISATPVRGTAIGTGATIMTVHNDGREEENTALIFGDTNGDGWYDGTDSIVANCLANGMLTRDQVGEAVYMAADCNCDGLVNKTDIYILENAGLFYLEVAQDGKKNTEMNVPYTGDISYDEDTFFISDIYIATSNLSLSSARSTVSSKGYTPISYDLNKGAGGAYICMGYRTTDNYDEAIKDIRFYADSKDTNDSVVGLKFGNTTCSYTMANKTDLNYRASGDYVYAYYTKDSAAGPAITAINFGTPEEMIGRRIAVLLSDQNAYADLNSNTSKHSTTIYCALTDVGA